MFEIMFCRMVRKSEPIISYRTKMTYLEIIMEASKVDVLRTHPVLDSSKIMSKFMTLKLVKTFGIYMNAFLAYKTWDNVLQQSCFTSALNGKKVEKQYLKCNEEMPSKNEQKGVSTRYMKLHVQRFDFFYVILVGRKKLHSFLFTEKMGRIMSIQYRNRSN